MICPPRKSLTASVHANPSDSEINLLWPFACFVLRCEASSIHGNDHPLAGQRSLDAHDIQLLTLTRPLGKSDRRHGDPPDRHFHPHLPPAALARLQKNSARQPIEPLHWPRPACTSHRPSNISPKLSQNLADRVHYAPDKIPVPYLCHFGIVSPSRLPPAIPEVPSLRRGVTPPPAAHQRVVN